MNFENMNIWCWLIPLLVGILCGIIGYLFGKGSATSIDHSAELKLMQDKNAKLQGDLDACTKKAIADSDSGNAAASFATETAATSKPFDSAAAKAVFGKAIKQDDLKVVEGIGPKIEGMFRDAGIKTWKALSDATVAECQKVLDIGGKRYRIHDPASWPMQAKMAYEGKWQHLFKWQNKHDHGKL